METFVYLPGENAVRNLTDIYSKLRCWEKYVKKKHDTLFAAFIFNNLEINF